MPFTGALGTINSEPGNIVPMFGAGGHRYAQSLSGNLSFSGSIATAITRVFRNISLTLYRAVYRAYARWSTYSVVVLGDNPVGYWRLGDPVGAVTAFDSSGFLNLGTLHGTVTLGNLGGLKDNSSAMQFDGSTGYIALGAESNLGSSTLSLEALVNHNGIAWSGSGEAVVSHPSPDCYLFVFNGNIFFGLSIGGTLRQAQGGGVSNSGWHHLVATWDGANQRVYIDGVLSFTSISYLGATGANTGSWFIGSYNGSANKFNGSLEEVAVYPYALTQQQVTNHYTAMVTYPPTGFTTALRTSQ